MAELNEYTEEQTPTFNDCGEQDSMMLMLANASYHYFLMEDDDENNEKRGLTN